MKSAQKIKSREEIEQNYKWQINRIYENDSLWEEDFSKLKSLVPSLSAYEGKLKSGEELLKFIKLDEEIGRLAEKLHIYAHCRADEDTSNTKYQSLWNKIVSFIPQINGEKAFFLPEILSIDEKYLLAEIKRVPGLELYSFAIENILSLKPHALSKGEEKILASVSDTLEAPANIFNMLLNADMTFPKIKNEKGEEVELSDKNYSIYITSKDRNVRCEAFKALFSTYEKFKNTLATSLTSSMKAFIFTSQMRRYSSSLESSLKPNNIPLEVYHKAIETINNNLSALHRYVSLKKKMLKLDEIHMYDLYVPIIDTPDINIAYEEGVELIRKGLAPLGKEYLTIFNEGIDNGWVDVYENKGKRGGAYSTGSYDTMPYILLNYHNKINDVSTLAHEMGHSIHSYYSKTTQPYVYSNYTLFCAEVASITNECILIDYLIKNEKDKMKKLYFINTQLEQIRTTVFRQIMFAEFEMLAQGNLEEGVPLTSEELCNLWHDLNVKYFVPEMVVDKEIDMEWARIPHFYYNFYVYQYATGYAAANSFAERILNSENGALESYISFLKSGGSDYPINLLKKSGVDMTTSKPMEETIKRFNELLSMLEANLS